MWKEGGVTCRTRGHSPTIPRIDDYFDELLFAAAALLILGGIAALRKTRRFIANCRNANGRITGFTKEEADEGPDFYFSIIRFADDAGAEHEIRGPHGSQEPPTVGTPVAITYDPAYPTNAWITGTASPWVIPWLLVIAGVAAAIGGLVVRAEQ